MTWAHQDLGIPFFMACLRVSVPHSGAVTHTGTLCHLSLDLTKVNGLPRSPCGIQAALKSLAHPHYLVSVCDTCWLSREERCLMEAQAPSDLAGFLPCPAVYIIYWAMNIWRNQLDWPVFPAIHEALELLKGTFLIWKPRKSLTPEYLLFTEHSHSVCMSVWAHVVV
jgi:hypothetical protein